MKKHFSVQPERSPNIEHELDHELADFLRSRSGRRERTRWSSSPAEQPNPYVGPRSFEENESEFFFGRDQEIEILVGLVMARRVALFFAQSGAGKSSLLRAGLIPDLTCQETIGRGRRARTYQKMSVLPILNVGGAIPGYVTQPISNVYIFSALFSLLPDTNPNQLANLTLTEGLKPLFTEQGGETTEAKTRSRPSPSGDMSTLLIFDQFEELFTKHLTRWQDREDFFRQIGQAVETYPTLHVLFTMREDYIAELTPYANLLPEQLRPRFRLERLQREAALQAVRQPAARAGRFYDEGVAEELVDNLRRTQSGLGSRFQPEGEAGAQGETEILGAYVEPVHLQIVCHQLWNNLPQNEVMILAKDVKEFGDVDQALIGFYEDSLAKVMKEIKISERRLRKWFDVQLITQAHTRNLVYRGDIETEGLPNEAIDILNNAYIIRANTRGNDAWYELAHDRMVEPILTSNQNWRVTYYNPLANAMQTWLASGRDPRKLLRGSQLKRAQAYAESHPEDVMEEEQAFLEESMRYLNPLAQATQAWLDAARDPERLLDGSQLEDARTFAGEHGKEMSEEEVEFLAESIRQQKARQEAARLATARRRRLLIAGIIVVVLLSILSLVAAINANNASRQKETAEVLRVTAEAAEAIANEQKATAQAASTQAVTARDEARIQKATAQFAATIAIKQKNVAQAAREEQAKTLETLLTAVAQTPETVADSLPTPTPTGPLTLLATTPTPEATPTPDFNATATVEALQDQLANVRATQTVAALESSMARVPAGSFLMGSLQDSSGEPQEDEFPQRTVFLPEFWIDRTEVTNAAYRECVEAGRCQGQTGGDFNYHNNPAFDDYPVKFVSWEQALTYCQWVGKRLPTEAEWEKAARGTDGRIWPWGNKLQDDPAFPVQRANVGESNIGGITKVGSLPTGASPYGALDMTGNIWEWTADWYKPTYYRERQQLDPDSAPPGPPEEDSTRQKVIRGGSYLTPGIDARTAERNAVSPGPSFDIGFRCVRPGG